MEVEDKNEDEEKRWIRVKEGDRETDRQNRW